MLLEIRSYLSSQRIVSVNDLSNRFDLPPDVIRAMLAHWIKKGKVKEHLAQSVCLSSCKQCEEQKGECFSDSEMYEWTEVDKG